MRVTHIVITLPSLSLVSLCMQSEKSEKSEQCEAMKAFINVIDERGSSHWISLRVFRELKTHKYNGCKTLFNSEDLIKT